MMEEDVTIVITSYNEEKHIEAALLSIVKQAKYILVSDNASEDSTASICKKLAKKYSNINFFEQERNIGALESVKFLLKKVSTKFVMYMGAHDRVSENYIHTLKETLNKNEIAVMAYAPCIEIDDEDKIIQQYSLDEFDKNFSSNDVFERVSQAITMNYNYAYFGLFRSSVFVPLSCLKPIAGLDHVSMAKFATKGKFIRNKNATFYLRVPSRENTEEKYMERITGKKEILDMTPMVLNLLDIIDKIPSDKLDKKRKYYNKAKDFLNEKYQYSLHSYFDKRITQLKTLKEKYIIYGAGTEAKNIIKKLGSDKVMFLVDKNPEMYNKFIETIVIKPIDSLMDSECKIIISIKREEKLIMKKLMQDYSLDQGRCISVYIIE